MLDVKNKAGVKQLKQLKPHLSAGLTFAYDAFAHLLNLLHLM